MVNPFVDTIYVNLSMNGGMKAGSTIFYDINGKGEFDALTAQTYTGTLQFAANTVLRAEAFTLDKGYSTPVTWTYVKDEAPVVTLTAPANGATVTKGTSVTLTSTFTDPEGPAPYTVKYYWAAAGGASWNLIGTGGTDASNSLTWPIGSAVSTGSTTLRAIVTDGRGLMGTSDVTVTVAPPPNVPPVISLDLPANNSTFTLPATVTLSATASDPDDAGANAIQKVDFFYNGQPLTSKTSPPWTFSYVNPTAGDYALTAVAYDNGTPQAHTTSNTVNVTVRNNKLPTTNISYPENGKTYYAPFIDSLRALASDADGSVVKVVFRNGNTVENIDNTPASWAYLKTYPAGSYKMTSTATDNHGDSTISDTVYFTVAANKSPVANAGVDVTQLWPANSVVLNGSASTDPEGTTLKYEWTGTGVTFSNATVASPTVTASVPGAYTITLKVTDLGTPPLSSTDQMIFTVNAKPAVTSQLTASGTAAVPFSYPIQGSGYPLPTFEVTGNPGWLTLNASNWTLSGTPPASGQFPVNIKAKNSVGEDTKVLNISISDSLYKPSITSPLAATGKVGTAFTYPIQAKGNPAPTFTTGTLPAGLSLLSGGVISGSPTVTGSYTIPLTATNSQGSDSKNLALTIASDPKITVDLDTLITVMEKAKATFTISATGFPAVSYTWQYCATSATGTFTNVGPNAATYAIDTVSSSSAGFYKVIVKNTGGNDATSRVCRLKVMPLPIPIHITASPAPLTVVVGDKVQFKAKATGEGRLFFQWFKGANSITAPKEQDTVFIIAAAAAGDGGIYKARVTNAFTDTTKSDTYAFSDTARLVVQLPKLPKPYIRPGTGPFYPTTKVFMGDDTSGTNIYYTTTGADPTQAATLFTTDSLLVDATKTLKARAYKPGFRASDITTETYTYTVPGKVFKPTISPPAPTFKISMKCTLTTTTPNAAIYYTLDGSSPLDGSPAQFNGSITLTKTTTIIAVAKRTGLIDSDTLMMTYTLEALSSKVLAPIISPAGGPFSGQQKITLTCPTDGALIWYTLDGTSPDTSSTHFTYVTGTPINLAKSAVLKVVATKKDFLTSDVVSQNYTLIPGPITAQPASDIIFDSTVTVKLTALPAGAIIRYTLDGTKPAADSPVFPAAGLPITTTTTVSSMAFMDGVASSLYSFSYTKRGGQLATPTPTTSNNQATFSDTVSISLYSTPGSDIYYTLTGEIPTASSLKYGSPFLVDSTVTLQAVAIQKGFTNSKIMVATYTLVPGKPTASPPGGSTPTGVKVKLSCASARASIIYTLDGKDPTPAEHFNYKSGEEISITTSGVLKAVAVAGNMASPVMEENYNIFGIQDFTLPPGKISFLEGGYTLRSPEDQSVTVLGRIAGSTPFNLTGFDGVQYVFTLSLGPEQAAGAEFPKLIFTAPSSDRRSMYKIDLSGKIYFISGADTVTLSQAGTYFMGSDVSPPTIKYISEAFDDQDSTRVSFQIEDNVANLSYDLKRNDDAKRNLSQQYVFSGSDLSFKLKHPPGTLKPLYIQLIVSDYQSASYYPPEVNTQLSLSQRLGAFKGPDAWSIGAANSPYDFISIPLSLDPPMTVKDFRAANPGVAIEGVAWSDAAKKYLPIGGDETLRPGQGYWLGARTLVSSLTLHSATTLPTGKGTFSVYLKHGWNQIGNPHMEELYWPFSRNLEEAYKGSPIKGLWEYVPAKYDFVESESLKPWRGYYVYNYLEDKTVNLSPTPITIWSMKQAGQAGNSGRINLSLGWGATRSVRLGADPTSADGLGLEDEFSLPRRGGVFMQALRNGNGLTTDWVRLRQDEIHEWKVAMDGAGDSLPPLRILEQDLPAGYETWAVSPSRSMKFRLEKGGQIPASGLAQDTLNIYSGPREKMARFSLLQNLSSVAPSLDLELLARNGGFNMQMALPSKARLRAAVWTLQGARKGEFTVGPLSEGRYAFSYEADFHNRPARLEPGIYFLSLEIQGAGLNTRLARKIVLQQ